VNGVFKVEGQRILGADVGMQFELGAVTSGYAIVSSQGNSVLDSARHGVKVSASAFGTGEIHFLDDLIDAGTGAGMVFGEDVIASVQGGAIRDHLGPAITVRGRADVVVAGDVVASGNGGDVSFAATAAAIRITPTEEDRCDVISVGPAPGDPADLAVFELSRHCSSSVTGL
jgi:hypothetical protein